METLMKYMVTRDILKAFTLTDPVVLNTHLADIEDILKASMLVCVCGWKHAGPEKACILWSLQGQRL